MLDVRQLRTRVGPSGVQGRAPLHGVWRSGGFIPMSVAGGGALRAALEMAVHLRPWLPYVIPESRFHLNFSFHAKFQNAFFVCTLNYALTLSCHCQRDIMQLHVIAFLRDAFRISGSLYYTAQCIGELLLTVEYCLGLGIYL